MSVYTQFLRLRRRVFSRKEGSRIIKDILLISIGILSAGFGLKGFLLPSGFIDGGVTGISLLIGILFNIPVPMLIFFFNIPFILIAYKQVTKVFALKTFIAISGLALCLTFVEYPVITTDKLLVSFFGGFFLGAGIGLSIRGGSVLDGTEVLALYVSRKSSLTIGDVILIINIVIFSIAAILLNTEVAMYAILTYLAASKTVDFIVNGIEEYMGVTIISDKSDRIRKSILVNLGRGVTIYKGRRGFRRKEEHNYEIDIIYTVVTRLELTKLMNEIDKIDPEAFIVQQSISDTKGGMIKKRPLH